MIALEAFNNIVKYLQNRNPEWRYGQTLFNALSVIDPEFSANVISTKYLIDSFYVDGNAPAFMDYLIDEGIIIA